MFTTMMLRPSMLKLTEWLDMLQSFEKRILTTDVKITSMHQVAFLSQKNDKDQAGPSHTKEFTSQNKGFRPLLKIVRWGGQC